MGTNGTGPPGLRELWTLIESMAGLVAKLLARRNDVVRTIIMDRLLILPKRFIKVVKVVRRRLDVIRIEMEGMKKERKHEGIVKVESHSEMSQKTCVPFR